MTSPATVSDPMPRPSPDLDDCDRIGTIGDQHQTFLDATVTNHLNRAKPALPGTPTAEEIKAAPLPAGLTQERPGALNLVQRDCVEAMGGRRPPHGPVRVVGISTTGERSARGAEGQMMTTTRLTTIACALALLSGCATPPAPKPLMPAGNRAGPELVHKYVTGDGTLKCSEWVKARELSTGSSPHASLYVLYRVKILAWAQGFQSGWNVRSLADDEIDTSQPFNIGGDAYTDLDAECAKTPNVSVFDAMTRIVHRAPKGGK